MGSPDPRRTRAALLCALAAQVLLLLAAPVPCTAAEPAIPTATGYVTDAAGILGEWAAKTESLCRDIERRTTSEVAVLTVKTTVPLDAQQYAQQVFDRWKIGKKGKDNGVLILVAVDDRKMWIATGYGVEGVLPDGKAGEIRDRILRPLFRQSRYGEGVYMGVKAVGSILSGEAAEMPKGGSRRGRGVPLPVLILVLLLAVPFLILRSLLAGPFGGYRRGGRGMWYGGGGGFGGGGFGGGGFGGFGGGSSGGGGAGGGW
jgi:uncharacterized protein